jgi:hypothetical protein
MQEKFLMAVESVLYERNRIGWLMPPGNALNLP